MRQHKSHKHKISSLFINFTINTTRLLALQQEREVNYFINNFPQLQNIVIPCLFFTENKLLVEDKIIFCNHPCHMPY